MPKDYTNLLRQSLRDDYVADAEAFASNPSAANWQRLEDSMFCHQAVCKGGVVTSGEQATIVDTTPIAGWRDAVLAICKGTAED